MYGEYDRLTHMKTTMTFVCDSIALMNQGEHYLYQFAAFVDQKMLINVFESTIIFQTHIVGVGRLRWNDSGHLGVCLTTVQVIRLITHVTRQRNRR